MAEAETKTRARSGFPSGNELPTAIGNTMQLTATDLRPYQLSAALGVEEHWDKGHRRVLVCHAVGTGKTFLGSYLAHAWLELGLAERYDLPARVLWTAYTDEQVEQAVETIEGFTGEAPAIEKADRSIRREPSMLGKSVVVTSVQTMMREGRLAFFGPDNFGLIIWDESHHIICDGAQPILEHFPNAHIAGLTATPNRTDRVPLGKIFQAAVPVYGMADAMQDGWLCRLLYKQIHVESIDWTQAIADSDLAEDRIAAIIEEEGDELHSIVRGIVDHSEDRPTIIYAPRVLASRVIVDLLNSRYAPEAGAEFVCGSTPADQRRDIVGRFREGRYQYIANSAVFLEGTDLRNASCAALAVPVKSELRFEQMVGRILRGGANDPVPGKRDAILLDLIGSSRKHKLVSPVDLLGGKWDACVRDEAFARLTEQSADVPVDVLELIDVAKSQAEEIRLEERRRIVAEIKSKVKTVDPFDLWPEAAADTEIDEGWWEHRLADEDQVKRLKDLGIPIKGVTALEARKLLREASRRRRAGLCSYKAARQLRTQGISGDLMHEQATDIMQFLGRTGGFRPTPDAFQRAKAARNRGRLFEFHELRLSYKVPAGTICTASRAADGKYVFDVPLATRQDNSFGRPIEHQAGYAIFEKDGWRLRVPRSGYVVTLLGWGKKSIGA